MRQFLNYIMRGRKEAVLVALLFSFLPFFRWVAPTIMALVTLRQGTKEGAIVLLWILLPSVVFAIFYDPRLWLYDVLAANVAVYVMAVVLRHYRNWASVLFAATLVGIIAVIVVHVVYPDITLLMQRFAKQYLTNVRQQHQWQISNEQIAITAKFLGSIGIGLQVSIVILLDLFCLIMARWAQAILYNPGGLQAELHNIRLSMASIILLPIVLFGGYLQVSWILDCLPVVLMPYLFAGASFIHFWVKQRRMASAWLALFYGLLFFLLPYVLTCLVILALWDYWGNLRQRIPSK